MKQTNSGGILSIRFWMHVMPDNQYKGSVENDRESVGINSNPS